MEQKRKMSEEDWQEVWSRERERIEAAVREGRVGIPSRMPEPRRRRERYNPVAVAAVLTGVSLAGCVVLAVLQGAAERWTDQTVYGCAVAWLAVGVAIGAAVLTARAVRKKHRRGLIPETRSRREVQATMVLTSVLLVSVAVGVAAAMAITPNVELAEAITNGGGALADKKAIIDKLFMVTAL
jgi:hypothetical protein